MNENYWEINKNNQDAESKKEIAYIQENQLLRNSLFKKEKEIQDLKSELELIKVQYSYCTSRNLIQEMNLSFHKKEHERLKQNWFVRLFLKPKN